MIRNISQSKPLKLSVNLKTSLSIEHCERITSSTSSALIWFLRWTYAFLTRHTILKNFPDACQFSIRRKFRLSISSSSYSISSGENSSSLYGIDLRSGHVLDALTFGPNTSSFNSCCSLMAKDSESIFWSEIEFKICRWFGRWRNCSIVIGRWIRFVKLWNIKTIKCLYSWTFSKRFSFWVISDLKFQDMIVWSVKRGRGAQKCISVRQGNSMTSYFLCLP